MAARFSERIGLRKPKQIQVGEIDADLKNSLWNTIAALVGEDIGAWYAFARRAADGFFKRQVDDVPIDGRTWLRAEYHRLSWSSVYEFVEFAAGAAKGWQFADKARKDFNRILERELSGYRFIGKELVPISDRVEVEAIEGALASPLYGPREHVAAALESLGRKPEPDHRSAIREAISAVESTAKLVTGKNKATLSAALAVLAQKTNMHPALSGAFDQLYGYTSDEKGIRHSLLDEKVAVGFHEAKFMVVACSAFVNFMLGKADAAGLLK